MHSPKKAIVLITGGSHGIGAETALAFARRGARIILTYNKGKADAETLADLCMERGAFSVEVFELNVMENASIRALSELLSTKIDHIDVLINNAGTVEWGPLLSQSFDDIERQVRTNVEGLIKITKVLLPNVTKAIVNIGSGAGIYASPRISVYSATKFAVRGFTQSLAREHPDLRIVAVNPGTTATRMTDYAGVAPEKVADIIVKTAMGEVGETGGDVNVFEIL